MRAVLLTLLAVAAGCGDDSSSSHWPDAGTHTTDAPPPWWQPTPGSIGHWDIQLAPPFETDTSRTMMVYPLWDLVPTATTIDYGDGAPVQVPAGALAGRLLSIHARRPQPVVICEFGTGSVDLTEPDAKKFPGYKANPPDDPTLPEADSVIGWSTTLRANRRWLDIRGDVARGKIAPILQKRFDLAVAIGCDGVLPDDNDMYRIIKNDGTGAPGSGTGFATPAAIDFEGEATWFEAVAAQGHTLKLTMGMRGDYANMSGRLKEAFDWEIADRCGEFMDCDSTREFAQLHKAVLGLDYDHDVDGGPQNVGTTCGSQKASNVLDGIVKDPALTSSSYFACTDFVSALVKP